LCTQKDERQKQCSKYLEEDGKLLLLRTGFKDTTKTKGRNYGKAVKREIPDEGGKKV